MRGGIRQGGYEGARVIMHFEASDIPFQEPIWLLLLFRAQDLPDLAWARVCGSESHSPFIRGETIVSGWWVNQLQSSVNVLHLSGVIRHGVCLIPEYLVSDFSQGGIWIDRANSVYEEAALSSHSQCVD